MVANMEVNCPVCSSANQKETLTNIKFIEPQKNTKVEVPALIYICLDCGEDWQTAAQHQIFCNERDKLLQNLA